MPFSTKMHSSCSTSYKIEYKATVMVFFIIVLTVHKYKESNVDFNLFLNCSKLGNCVMALARLFHMGISPTVINNNLLFMIKQSSIVLAAFHIAVMYIKMS